VDHFYEPCLTNIYIFYSSHCLLFIGRRRTPPLAPACNVRLIRNDLSTIWCELTISIRTRPSNDVDKEFDIVLPPTSSSQVKTLGNNLKTSSDSGSESVGDDEKELLLCFRPIREGETVGEDLRYCARIKDRGNGEKGVDQASLLLYNNRKVVSTSTSNNEVSPFTTSEVATSSLHLLPLATSVMKKNRPPKKRKFTDSDDDNESQMMSRSSIFSSSRNCYSEDTQVVDIDEKSVVESMMSLAKHTP